MASEEQAKAYNARLESAYNQQASAYNEFGKSQERRLKANMDKNNQSYENQVDQRYLSDRLNNNAYKWADTNLYGNNENGHSRSAQARRDLGLSSDISRIRLSQQQSNEEIQTQISELWADIQRQLAALKAQSVANYMTWDDDYGYGGGGGGGYTPTPSTKQATINGVTGTYNSNVNTTPMTKEQINKYYPNVKTVSGGSTNNSTVSQPTTKNSAWDNLKMVLSRK